MSMLVTVTRKVALEIIKNEKGEDLRLRQIPVIVSTLTKELNFRK